MITLYVILTLIFLLLSIVLVRALFFKPEKLQIAEREEIFVDGEKAVCDLSDMIKCKTVSSMDSSAEDEGEFLRFEKLLFSYLFFFDGADVRLGQVKVYNVYVLDCYTDSVKFRVQSFEKSR